MDQRLPSFAYETWTPALAAEVLIAQRQFGNGANRRIKEQVVNRYATDMACRRWQQNGETLVFNGKRCLDGQHRLSAIVKSGVTLILLTVRNVDVNAMPTLDSGILRTPGDTLRGARFDLVGGYYNTVAAAIRLVFLYQNFRDVEPMPERQPSRAQLVDTLDANPGAVESAKWLHNAKHNLQRTKVIAAWHYLCGIRHAVERDAFFKDLINGVNLAADQPVRVLRERFLSERGSRAKLPSSVWSAFIVKAWNAEITGTPIKILRYRLDEVFPLLHGDEPKVDGR